MKNASMHALRKFALRLPDVEEGIACEGTAVESRTVRTRKKAFLFLRPKDARLKLDASLTDAAARASKEPDRYAVGGGGWVLVKFDDATDPLRVLERWVAESHSLFASKETKPVKSRAAKATSRAKAKRKK